MNAIRHKLALLAILALPAAAQTECPQVVFNVQIVQAGQTTRNALASASERQASDFNRDDQMSIHVLSDATDAPSLVSAQRGAGPPHPVPTPRKPSSASA